MGNVIGWINDNLVEDERQGEARKENQPQSVWAMINTLVPTLVVTSIYLFVFLVTRRSQKRFYAPRSYLGSLLPQERSPELPDGWFRWYKTLWKIPDLFVLRHQSLDAYLFLRYLRICTAICFVSLLITWPILLPLNITGGNGKSQLELLSYSNINIKTHTSRLYGHVAVAWVTFGFVLYMITRECIFYINLRQAYLLSPRSANRISSRTVLFTCVPTEYQDEGRIRAIFGSTVRNVWFAGDTKVVDELVERRDQTAMQLEQAEVDFLKSANKLQIRTAKLAEKQDAELDLRDVSSPELLQKLRPTRRTGFMGIFGEKVDAITWFREKLQADIPNADEAQAAWRQGAYKKVPAVFVEFNTHTEAQTAFQLVTHHHGFRMTPKYVGVRPQEVIWKNLGMSWWRMVISQYAVYLFVGALIVFWAIPVGLFGIIAQVSLIQSLPGLTWIQYIPDQILGVISGLLPAAVLSWLMSLVPGIMRRCARIAGAATAAEAELFTQNAYFIFQLLQVFLIRTITDTAASAIVQVVQDPTSVFSILAEALPTSSNFYISYFIIQGFTIAIDVMTQVVTCVFFNIMYRFGAGTPRRMYSKWTSLESVSWGSILPVHTGIVVISITYAVIAPFLLIWSTIGLWIFYQAYRYNIIFISDTKIHTLGLLYPKALKQLFAGLYIAEICLIGIFAVSMAVGQAVLMIVFLIFTILYHITLNRALDPLLYNMPCTIQAEEELLQYPDSDHDDSTMMEEGFSQAQAGQSSKPEERRPSVPWSTRTIPAYKPSFLQKFLMPWKFTDYWTLRRIVVRGDLNVIDRYPQEVEASAYLPPSVRSEAPVLWIPRDRAGVSKMEIEDTENVIGITDEGCALDNSNRLRWDTAEARPPIWTEKIIY